MSQTSSPLIFEPEETLSDLLRAARDVANSTVNTTDPTQQSVTISTAPNLTLTPTPTPVAPNATFTLTSEIVNVTSTIMSPTKPDSDNSTSVATGATTANTGGGGDGNMGGTIAAIVITVVLVIVFIGAVVYLYMRRRWKPHQKSAICFQPIRKRRSSTSDSRRTLEEIEVENPDKMGDHYDDRPNGGSGSGTGSRRPGKRQGQEELDAFTIDDLEEPEDDVGRGDEYYYDEVFGQSQFEDEATQNAVRQLYSTADDQREEELLDFDFETLGIKIEDYKIDSSRRKVNT